MSSNGCGINRFSLVSVCFCLVNPIYFFPIKTFLFVYMYIVISKLKSSSKFIARITNYGTRYKVYDLPRLVPAKVVTKTNCSSGIVIKAAL